MIALRIGDSHPRRNPRMTRIFGNPFRTPAPASRIGWETRYEGVLSVAVLDGVPVAGISGPWPDGHYALTWWPSRDADTPPTLEFYATMEAARDRVERVNRVLLRAAA